MLTDEGLRDAIGILSAHTFAKIPASPEVRAVAAKTNEPIWNTNLAKELCDVRIPTTQDSSF
jgi:hypothetical protein